MHEHELLEQADASLAPLSFRIIIPYHHPVSSSRIIILYHHPVSSSRIIISSAWRIKIFFYTGYEGEHLSVRTAPFDDSLFEKLKLCRSYHCLIAAGSIGVDKTRDLGRDSVVGSIVGGNRNIFRILLQFILLL